MNIFAFDDCPELSALWLDDVRKNKMIVESCQLMSTTINILCPGHSYNVYKTCFVNHPCAIWARESHANFVWLCRYTEHLLKQRKAPHGCSETLSQCRKFCDAEAKVFPEQYLTPFVNCAANQSLGISFKWVSNTNAAYRMYIRERWKQDTIKLSWDNGTQPWWK